ncbi:hypothetical protein SAMN05444920_1634 [Nonomuraea solani]|uniref:Peptidase inhibitor family I36 n=1 Tax=Nonomuraea solani TaxID=1144553 RepID=A0A1H6F4V5_9ACTN|nr:hypothetical protein [Nonomuraea solani]SEH04126.1 hypothetical protein SAMN05444920_1634 [Nonomuraea solani]
MRIQGKIALLALSGLAVPGLIAPAAHADPTPQPHAELVPAWDNPGPQGDTTYEGGSPAATGNAAAAPWRCLLYVSDPSFKKYNGRWHVEGVGRQSCTGAGYSPQGPRLTLQRYLGLGVWKNVVRTTIAWSHGGYAEMRKAWDCTRSGSEEYRWVVDGFAKGVPRVRRHAYSLHYLRVIC